MSGGRSMPHCDSHPVYVAACGACAASAQGIPRIPDTDAMWSAWRARIASEPVMCTVDRNCSGARDRVCPIHGGSYR